MGERDAVGLPPRPFFYTLDQIATLTGVDLETLYTRWVHYDGHTPGVHRKDKLKAVNLAPLDEPHNWRVLEAELIRWMRNRGFYVYERVRIR